MAGPRSNRLPSSGAGQGDSWGGPARGVGVGPRAQFQPGHKLSVGRASPDTERIEARAKLAEESLAVLAGLMRTAEREETRKSAAQAVNQICEGMPVARNINATVDDLDKLDVAELHAERARLARRLETIDPAGPGTAPAGLPH